jgi:hypothetical protein
MNSDNQDEDLDLPDSEDQANSNSSQPSGNLKSSKASVDQEDDYSSIIEPDAPKSSKLTVLAGIVVGLTIIAAGILLGLQVLKGPIRYSSSDLVNARTKSYIVAYPKEWQDTSNDQKLVANFGLLDSDFKDLKSFSYKLNKSDNTAQSVLLVVDQYDGIDNSVLTGALQNNATRDQMTSVLQGAVSQLSSANGSCKDISNKTDSIKYSTSHFIMQLNVDFDCSVGTGTNITQTHISSLIGMADSKVYLAAIESRQSDWSINGSFYQNYVLASLKPL